jgi:hypothetical protein
MNTQKQIMAVALMALVAVGNAFGAAVQSEPNFGYVADKYAPKPVKDQSKQLQAQRKLTQLKKDAELLERSLQGKAVPAAAKAVEQAALPAAPIIGSVAGESAAPTETPKGDNSVANLQKGLGAVITTTNTLAAVENSKGYGSRLYNWVSSFLPGSTAKDAAAKAAVAQAAPAVPAAKPGFSGWNYVPSLTMKNVVIGAGLTALGFVAYKWCTKKPADKKSKAEGDKKAEAAKDAPVATAPVAQEKQPGFFSKVAGGISDAAKATGNFFLGTWKRCGLTATGLAGIGAGTYKFMTGDKTAKALLSTSGEWVKAHAPSMNAKLGMAGIAAVAATIGACSYYQSRNTTDVERWTKETLTKKISFGIAQEGPCPNSLLTPNQCKSKEKVQLSYTATKKGKQLPCNDCTDAVLSAGEKRETVQ